jgi:hypothetical protein
LIWKKGQNRADIVLSVSTGVQIGAQGGTKMAKKSATEQMIKVLPRGIREKLATGYDMVQSTLSCEKKWEDFCKSIRDDDSRRNVSHRLNLGLQERPPKLDEVRKRDALQHRAEDYFRPESTTPYLDPTYKTGREHLQVVARRLIASLFYFEELERPQLLGLEQKTVKKTGFLRCRLSSHMKQQFHSLLGSMPQFRISEGDVSRGLPTPKFDDNAFSSQIDFVVSGDSYTIEIYFPTENWRGVWEPISGYS